MNKYAYWEDMDRQASGAEDGRSVEDVRIEMIDLKRKWGPILANRKTRKWELQRIAKSGSAEEQQQAKAILNHFYGDLRVVGPDEGASAHNLKKSKKSKTA